MDDESEDRPTLARQFLEPSNSNRRQYEALRAFFVEGLPSAEAARRFGYTPGRFRVLVHQFRKQGKRASFLPTAREGRPPGKQERPREQVVALRERNPSVHDISRAIARDGDSLSPAVIAAILNAVAMKVNGDMPLSLMAGSLYRLLAVRIGNGYEVARSRHLFRDFIDGSAEDSITEGEVAVRYQERAHNTLRVAAGLDKAGSVVPWLGKERLRLNFGSPHPGTWAVRGVKPKTNIVATLYFAILLAILLASFPSVGIQACPTPSGCNSAPSEAEISGFEADIPLESATIRPVASLASVK